MNHGIAFWPRSLTVRRMLIAAMLLCICSSTVKAANSRITNPADKISNPADTMYNPAADMKNPANSIKNPAERMASPDPLYPPAPPAAQRTEQVHPQSEKESKPVVQKKYYTFKKVKEYIAAAKKAFVGDDYQEFIAITEDALRRIDAGSLKASALTRRKLLKYQKFGYSLLQADKN